VTDARSGVSFRQAGLEPLLTARALVLYGLSLHSAASAYWAWPSGDPALGLVAIATALALAVLVAERLAPQTGSTLDGESGRVLRIELTLLYAGAALLGLSLAAGGGDPRMVADEVIVFSGIQAAAVLLRRRAIVVANALLLVIFAAFHGGVEAAFAVTGYAGWLVFLLCLDHFYRQLSEFPTTRSHLAQALRQAARLALPLVAALAIVFAVSPPRPSSRLAHDEVGRGQFSEELAEAYRRLLLVGVVSGVLVFVLFRWRREAADQKPAPDEEAAAAERGEEEILDEPERQGKVVYRGRRGRIVRAYLRLLARAAERRFRRSPGWTATQIMRQLREPAGPLATITARFTSARYGPDEPEEEDVRAAETAVDQVLAHWRRRTAGRRPG
jgi:hypothetical protein